MAIDVFPNQPNGQITEARWTGTELAIRAKTHGIVYGFDLSDAGSGTISAGAGEAFVSGYHVVSTAAITKALSNGSPRFLWLTTAGALAESADDTPPNGDDLFLAHVTVAAGSITAIAANGRLTSWLGMDETTLSVGRRPYASHGTMSTGTIGSPSAVAKITLAPGLWLLRGWINGSASGGGAGQQWRIHVDGVTGAAQSAFRLVVLPAGTPANACWREDSTLCTFTTIAHNDKQPVLLRGIVDVPDGGTIEVHAETSSFHIVQAGGAWSAVRLK